MNNYFQLSEADPDGERDSTYPEPRVIHIRYKSLFDDDLSYLQTVHLMTGKSLSYIGELYSDEHRRKFTTNDITTKVGTNNGKLILAIDGLHIGEWV